MGGELAAEDLDIFGVGFGDGVAGIVGDLNVEVDGDYGFGFDPLTVLDDRFEVPLADGLLRSCGKNGRTAYYVKILYDAVGSDHGLQDDRALHVHVLRQQRVGCLRDLSRYRFALGSVGGRGKIC